MAKIVAIVGDTGTGKSTSLETLNPKETFVINCANKPLPFKGSSSQYSLANKNMISMTTSKAILAIMEEINTKQPHIKNLIIDDSGFVMTELFFLKAMETGFSKFTEIARAYQGILVAAKNMRADLNVAFMLHEEDETSNSIKVKKKPKTVGKLVDDQYSPLSVVSIALFTNVSYDKDGNASYNFITNRTMINGVEIPAKSPRGMFSSFLIPNDLAMVFKAADEYYAGE
jgi:hypothetical protein